MKTQYDKERLQAIVAAHNLEWWQEGFERASSLLGSFNASQESFEKVLMIWCKAVGNSTPEEQEEMIATLRELT